MGYPSTFGNALGQALASNGAGQQAENALQAHEDARDQALWNSVGGGSSSGSQVSGVLPQSYLDDRVFADKGNVPSDVGGLRVYGMVPQRVENNIQNVVFDGGYDNDANAEAQLVHNSNDELITNEDRERDRYFRKESAKVRAQDVENDNIAAQQQAARLARVAQEATARSQIGLNNTSSLVELNSRTGMSAAALVTTEAVTNNYEGMFSLTMTDQERNRPDAVTQWKDGILSSIVESGARSRYTAPYAIAYGIVDTALPGSSGELILMGGGVIAGGLAKVGRTIDSLFANTGASLPLLPRASLGNVETREFYLEGERQISALNEFLKTQPLSTEQRAIELINTRNALRSEARALMSDRERAELLKVTDPNMTVPQLVQKTQKNGFSGEALWEELANSASRSRPSVNQSLGVKP